MLLEILIIQTQKKCNRNKHTSKEDALDGAHCRFTAAERDGVRSRTGDRGGSLAAATTAAAVTVASAARRWWPRPP